MDLVAYERLMRSVLRPDPALLIVPSELGGVAERNIVDVDEDLVLVLTVPHLHPRVARVEQDRAHGGFRPGDAASMGVACPVVRRRTQDPVASEALGDGQQTLASNKLCEDPADNRRSYRVGFQPVEPLSVGSLGRVGMRTGIRKPVTVRRPASEIAALHFGLRRHCRSDPGLDPVSLAFTDPAEHRHDQFMGLVHRVDRAADLGHPQVHPVMLEEGEGKTELVAVEGALGLAHYDGRKAAVGVGQFGEQQGGLRPTHRRDRSRLVHIEELRDDPAAARLY
nr:hypothetical protein [Nonomuraea sp. NEAU-A123]